MIAYVRETMSMYEKPFSHKHSRKSSAQGQVMLTGERGGMYRP